MSEPSEPDQSSEPLEPTAEPTPAGPPEVGFIIAGVQKAGTTSLYAMVAAHPQVAPAKKKELHFFDDEKLDWDNPPYDRYHQKIKHPRGSVIAGEASPRYVFWPGAMERIHAYNPEMLIILSFRDPIERAFSHWGMSTGKRNWKWDFTETIRRGWNSGWPRTKEEYGRNTAKTILARGYYGAQLEHTLEIFDREQVLLLDYHRLFRELDTSLARITDFLGIDRYAETPDTSYENTAPQNLVAKPPTAGDVSRLAELYADDQARFVKVSGFDVSAWPTSRLLAGTLSAAEFAERLAARANLVAPETEDGKPRASVGTPAPVTAEPAAPPEPPGAPAGEGSAEPSDRSRRREKRRQKRKNREHQDQPLADRAEEATSD